MTDRQGDNVWGTPPPSTPVQRWQGRPEVEPTPSRRAGLARPTSSLPAPVVWRTERWEQPEVVVWAMLAFVALLLVLFSFIRWDRPVDTAPVGPTDRSTKTLVHEP